MRTWSLGLAFVVLACVSSTSDEAPSEPVARPEPAGDSPEVVPRPGSPSSDVEPTPSNRPASPCDGQAGRTLRTLVIGNSQIYFFDLPKILSDVSESAHPDCPRIAAEGFTRGGQNLERLWKGGDSQGRDLATVLETGRYDVAVITESIDLVELEPPYDRFVRYATILVDAARASGARPILYATPYADQPGHAWFAEMAAPQLALGEALSVTVAAGGLAWLRVWDEMPSVFLHHVDHAHPGPKGSYISALVLYAAITGATPIGLTTNPPIACFRGMCPDDPLLTPAEGEVFQRAAWEEAKATSLR
jgi:hypothetical protein